MKSSLLISSSNLSAFVRSVWKGLLKNTNLSFVFSLGRKQPLVSLCSFIFTNCPTLLKGKKEKDSLLNHRNSPHFIHFPPLFSVTFQSCPCHPHLSLHLCAYYFIYIPQLLWLHTFTHVLFFSLLFLSFPFLFPFLFFLFSSSPSSLPFPSLFSSLLLFFLLLWPSNILLVKSYSSYKAWFSSP